MTQWEEDGSLVCPRCKTTFDVHALVSPDCPGDDEEDEPMTIKEALDKLREKHKSARYPYGTTVFCLSCRMETAPCPTLALAEALDKAGQWVAAVEPKLPMPGTGDTQQEVLDMIERALIRAAGGEE